MVIPLEGRNAPSLYQNTPLKRKALLPNLANLIIL